jgi:hypothetical protein
VDDQGLTWFDQEREPVRGSRSERSTGRSGSVSSRHRQSATEKVCYRCCGCVALFLDCIGCVALLLDCIVAWFACFFSSHVRPSVLSFSLSG